MDHTFWMRRCLDLALRGSGSVSPNPLVGAVIVHENRVIGEGWHRQYGMEHAEVNAFNAVSEEDRKLVPDSTLYVNLEPCNHHGNTPPCSLRIHQEGIKKVVVGSVDPDPRVAGEGLAYLRDRGIEVTTGILEEECKFLNRFFYTFHQLQRPWVVLKWAESTDGYLGLQGRRTRISGTEAQVEVHRWRKELDAILIGVKTAVIDDPQLTDRWHGGNHPLRLIIDENGELEAKQKLVTDEKATVVISRTSQKFDMPANKEWIQIGEEEDMIDQILRFLFEKNKNSILVEGGRETLSRWIKSGKWDETRLITSGTELAEGIKAPVIRGKLYDRYFAGNNEVRVILNRYGSSKS